MSTFKEALAKYEKDRKPVRTLNKHPASSDPAILLKQLKDILGQLGYRPLTLRRRKHPEEFFAFWPGEGACVSGKGLISHSSPQGHSLIVRLNRGRARIRVMERGVFTLWKDHQRAVEEFGGDLVRISPWAYYRQGLRRVMWHELILKRDLTEIQKFYGPFQL